MEALIANKHAAARGEALLRADDERALRGRFKQPGSRGLAAPVAENLVL